MDLIFSLTVLFLFRASFQLRFLKIFYFSLIFESLSLSFPLPLYLPSSSHFPLHFYSFLSLHFLPFTFSNFLNAVLILSACSFLMLLYNFLSSPLLAFPSSHSLPNCWDDAQISSFASIFLFLFHFSVSSNFLRFPFLFLPFLSFFSVLPAPLYILFLIAGMSTSPSPRICLQFHPPGINQPLKSEYSAAMREIPML